MKPQKILAVWLFILLFFNQGFSSLDRYPEWFLFPLKYPEVVVGYSYGGNPALYDAENMYCAYRSCVVYGTLEIFSSSTDDQWLKNSDYFYYFSPDSVKQIHGKLVQVDSFQTNLITGDYIAAFTFGDTLQDRRWIEVQSLTPPEWLQKIFWRDGQYYYGVGFYTSIGNENDAWKTAEEQAVFTILTNLAIGYYKLRLYLKDGSEQPSVIEEISFIRLKYLLRNIEIMERFPDRSNRLFYVLVRIPQKDVVSPMLMK